MMLMWAADILLHESGHIQLSDFDLSKSSETSQPALIRHYTSNGMPMIDTKSCVSDFRANVSVSLIPPHQI